MIVSSKVKIYSDSALTILVATVNGTTSSTQTIAVTGLNPSTQYWAQAEAEDNNGLTGYSPSSTFTTAAANYVFSGSGVSYSSAYNLLDVDIAVTCAGATFTACGIQFSTNSDFSGTLITGYNAGDDFVDEVGGFAENTLYYYRYYATSTEFGTQYYAPTINTITTHYAQPIIAVTHSNVTDTTATVTATYTGNLPIDTSEATFTYHISGQSNVQYINIDNMVAGSPYSVNLSGLTPNTQYVFEFDHPYYDTNIVATDTLLTLPARPVITITGVSDITPSSATIGISIT